MKKIVEQFLKGYRLAYSNIKFFTGLSLKERTYETYFARMEWQESRKAGLGGFSRFGGWICIILHFPRAVRLHMATNMMLKDKKDRGI